MRSPERENQRNGYRPCRWDTRAGTIGLNIPKLRKGSFFHTVLEPHRTAEKAVTAVIREACIHGVSTRAVEDLVRAMGLTGNSKSQVSRLCEPIDARVQAFLNRPLEGDWPFLWRDATGPCGGDTLFDGARVGEVAVCRRNAGILAASGGRCLAASVLRTLLFPAAGPQAARRGPARATWRGAPP